MSRARWGLVVFDNDGVIVDSEALAERAMSETLTSLGYPMTPEEVGGAFRGSTLARTRRLIEQQSGHPLPPSFEEMMRINIFGLMSKYLQPVPGIEKVLDYLDAEGMPFCLASSGRRDRIRFALETAGRAGSHMTFIVGKAGRVGRHLWRHGCSARNFRPPKTA